MTIILYALFLKLRIVYDFSDTGKSKTIGTQNINVVVSTLVCVTRYRLMVL